MNRLIVRPATVLALLSLTACVTARPTDRGVPAKGTAPGAITGTAPPAYPHAARIDSLMATWNRQDSPGGIVGVVVDGEVVFARGYGMANLTHGVPITQDTRFNVGSVAKQFTAFAVALLESRGRLSIDDAVTEYLPELPSFDQQVTLRHLLSHTSG